MNEPTPPAASLALFIDSLVEPHRFQLGEVTVVRQSDGYEMLGPGATAASEENALSPEAFRQWVRHTEAGQYRPLSGSLGMRRNWRRRYADVETLVAELEMLYPLALAHLWQFRAGRLSVVPPEEVLKRHGVRLVPGEVRALHAVQEVLCSRCVRCPMWDRDAALGVGQVPCPEPCSVWVSLCRRALHWARHPPAAEDASATVGFADFGVAGNSLRVEVCRRLAACDRAK